MMNKQLVNFISLLHSTSLFLFLNSYHLFNYDFTQASSHKYHLILFILGEPTGNLQTFIQVVE